MNKFYQFLLLTILLIPHSAVAKYKWAWDKYATGRTGAVYGITQDKYNNIYICGNFVDTCYFGSYTLTPYKHNVTAYFIAKFSENGTLVWAKRTQHTTLSICADNEGNIYTAGTYRPLSDSSVVAKYDSAGNDIWQVNTACVSAHLAIDHNDNLFIAGMFQDSMAIGGYKLKNPSSVLPHPYASYIVRLDTYGHIIWAKQSVNPMIEADADNIKCDLYGNLYVTGGFAGSYTANKIVFDNDTFIVADTIHGGIFLLKLDTAGNIKGNRLVSSVLGGWAGWVGDQFCGLNTDISGNVFVSGTFQQLATFIDTIKLQNLASTSTDLEYNGFLAKFDSTGKINWAKPLSGYHENTVLDLATDTMNHIWLSGYFAQDVIVDTFHLHTTAYENAAYLAEYDENGNVLVATKLDGGGRIANRIVADNYNNLYFSGYYCQGGVIIGSDTLPLPSGCDVFIAKYVPDFSDAGVRSIANNSSVSVFPNPASDKFTILYSGAINNNAKIELYNISGSLVFTTAITNERTVISTTGLAAGMYICRLVQDGYEPVYKKLIIE